MRRRVILLLSGFGFTIGLVACGKTEVMPPFSSIKIKIEHNANQLPLVFNTFNYYNQAGNTVNFSICKYYLSGVQLKKSNTVSFNDHSVFFVEALENNYSAIEIDSIPPGNYDSLIFFLGLQPHQNLSNCLPQTWENINMIWPESMGGGYHFFKMEGHFLSGTNYYGFAFHLGKNDQLLRFSFPLFRELKYHNEPFTVKADLMEWFKTPTLYDLSIHEPYTMADDSVMHIVAENGTDFFTIP